MFRSIEFFKRYFKDYRLKAGIYIILSINHYGLLLGIPYITKLLIDSVQFKDFLMFKKYALGNIVMILFFQVNIVFLDYLKEHIEIELLDSLRKDIYRSIYYKDYESIRHESIGYYMERFFDDCENVKSLIIGTYISMFLDGVFCLLIFIIIYRMSRPVFFILLLIMPLFIFLNYYFTPKIEAVNRDILREKENLKTGTEEYINGIKAIKVNNSFDYSRDKLGRNLGSYKKHRYSEVFLNIRYDDIYVLTLMNLLSVLMNIVGGYQVLVSSITFGTFISLNLYYSRLWNPIEKFMIIFKEIRVKNLSIDRLDSLLKGDSERLACSLEEIDRIELVDIGVRFEDRILFHDMNLTIKRGDSLGIKGGNGRGKSIIANMIVGLFKDYEGGIYYNGKDYREIDPISLRERIVLIPADNIIFNGSIRENILLGKDYDLDMFRDSGMFKVFERNDRDLNTVLTNKGEELSGGEKRLIQLMRGLVRDGDLYIIDEPLNYVDKEYKKDIVEFLEEFLRNKTSLIISHDDMAFLKESSFYEIENRKLS